MLPSSAPHIKRLAPPKGTRIAGTSPLQAARVADAPRRLEICRKAILERDFNAFASIVELDSDMMHAVMMTSTPALHYWKPASLDVMNCVRQWRMEGIPVCYTVDAGPNIHVLCLEAEAQMIEKRLREINGVDNVLVARRVVRRRLLRMASKAPRPPLAPSPKSTRKFQDNYSRFTVADLGEGWGGG